MGGTVINGQEQAVLRVCVTTAPEQGKANEAVLHLLAKTWGLSKTQITLVAGATAHLKTFRLTSLSDTERGRIETQAERGF